MASFSIFNSLKTAIYNKFSENPAKLMIFTGTAGWILSSLAQVGAIACNEKLTSNDVKFLIPQEISDGATNVGLFFVTTSLTNYLANHVIEKGKIMFKDVKAPLERAIKQKNITLDEALKTSKISQLLKGDEAALKNFTKLKGGATLAAALVGSIVSCNILTPIVRNHIGARWQKKLSENTALSINDTKSQISVKRPVQPAMQTVKPQILRQQSLPNIYGNFYSSGMKI